MNPFLIQHDAPTIRAAAADAPRPYCIELRS